MFRTSLDGQKIHLFRDAPPKTGLLEKGPKRPDKPTGIKDIQWSVFYYWWAFLRLNDDYLECCRNGGEGKLNKLYETFGDIWMGNFKLASKDASDCLGIFERWWSEIGVNIFHESVFIPPKILTEDYPHEVVLKFKSHAVIWIWLHSDIDFILEEIRKVLAPRIRAFRDTEWDNKFPYYRVHAKYRLPVLENTLKIAEAWRRLNNNRKAKEKPDQETVFIEAKLDLKLKKKLDPIELQTWRRKQVSEALIRATKLIANAGEGHFPDYSNYNARSFVFYEAKKKPRKSKSISN